MSSYHSFGNITVRTNDRVRIKRTGEEGMVAYVDGEYVLVDLDGYHESVDSMVAEVKFDELEVLDYDAEEDEDDESPY